MKNALTQLSLLGVMALGGCASLHEKDPLEGWNRAVFNFNDAVDRTALKPAAQGYRHLPGFVQTGVGNFFGNLEDVWTSANDFLQGKFADGLSDVMRVSVNTFFGLGGVLDIASEAGINKHKEDLGQTLGVWGIGPGPYIVLPILGPSTLRDTIATPVDLSAYPWAYKYPVRWRNAGYVLRAVDERAYALEATNLLEDAALDRYVFIRDGYLQRRESKILDGASPPAPSSKDQDQE